MWSCESNRRRLHAPGRFTCTAMAARASRFSWRLQPLGVLGPGERAEVSGVHADHAGEVFRNRAGARPVRRRSRRRVSRRVSQGEGERRTRRRMRAAGQRRAGGLDRDVPARADHAAVGDRRVADVGVQGQWLTDGRGRGEVAGARRRAPAEGLSSACADGAVRRRPPWREPVRPGAPLAVCLKVCAGGSRGGGGWSCAPRGRSRCCSPASGVRLREVPEADAEAADSGGADPGAAGPRASPRATGRCGCTAWGTPSRRGTSPWPARR